MYMQPVHRKHNGVGREVQFTGTDGRNEEIKERWGREGIVMVLQHKSLYDCLLHSPNILFSLLAVD